MSRRSDGERAGESVAEAQTWLPIERFRALVGEAVDGIPRAIRERIENVEIVVEDAPNDEILVDLGYEPGHDTLFGLYQGIPLGERGVGYSALPDRITIYYLPLTEEFRDEYHLRRQIRRTVVHEVGHYFGFDDRQLRRMGY